MQTRTLWIGAAVLVLATACNKNDTQSGSGNPQDLGRQASSITLTGCLQSAEQGLAPEPGASDRFVLANAKLPASEPASPSDSTGPLYILDGKTDELRQHLSQQVEVTGRLADDPASTPNSRRVEVDSVRTIAETCSR